MVLEYSDTEKVLQIYTLEEVLEHNDLTEVDLLDLLLENNLIRLPPVLPLDIRNDDATSARSASKDAD
jgi:hypothetical protein